MNKDVLFSSKSEEWETPDYVFRALDRKYHFTLDPCSSDLNHKTDVYFTKEQNGLLQSWGGHVVFCNPPYGRDVGKWVQKAFYENRKGVTVVLLLPARVDTKWFHEYIYLYHDVTFIRGRLKFGGSKNNAPFPSMIVEMRCNK